MRTEAPQTDLPGAEDVFNLAIQPGVDWSRVKAGQERVERDRKESASQQAFFTLEA